MAYVSWCWSNWLVQSFERWGELVQSGSAQLADLFPVMQKLPAFLTPNVTYAKTLHQIEKDLYVGQWMQAKRGLEDGTGLVNIPSNKDTVWQSS